MSRDAIEARWAWYADQDQNGGWSSIMRMSGIIKFKDVHWTTCASVIRRPSCTNASRIRACVGQGRWGRTNRATNSRRTDRISAFTPGPTISLSHSTTALRVSYPPTHTVLLLSHLISLQLTWLDAELTVSPCVYSWPCAFLFIAKDTTNLRS